MATDSRLQYLNNLRENLVAFLHPLQVVANAPADLYHFAGEYFTTHHRLLNENEQLRKQDLQQKVALQKLNALALENDTLRDLLQTGKSLTEISTLSEIVHVGRDPFIRKVIVNRGSNHQVMPGAAVVDAAGVVGQVTRVYPSSSEVTLITDKSLAIPIQIERNGLRAIAFGHGRDNTLDLPYLPANVDIIRGDKLITSGIDGVYPAGLAVAVVTEIKTTPDSPFARIVCQPIGGIENNRMVLLVSKPALGLDETAEAAQERTEKNAATAVKGRQKSATDTPTRKPSTENLNNKPVVPKPQNVSAPHA